MESRKVYVALILDAPNLERSEKNYVALLPLWSGYRTPTELRVEFTEFYDKLYLDGSVDPSEFAMVVPMAKVISAQRFDVEVYRTHFMNKDGEMMSAALGESV